MKPRWLLLLLVALGLHLPGRGEPPAPDFDREIAPILAQRCLDCHRGPKPKGGLDLSRPAAVVPGNLDDSPLWQRVTADEMPPKKPLPAAEKQLLRAWILAGGKRGPGPLDPFRYTTAVRAGYDWWALQPVRSPLPPPVRDPAWCRNPIDRFILARLEAEGLTPSPEADPRTLIRRVTFDLIGLPPTPEETALFLREVGAKPQAAYAALVERLLASPHYGERWARHWLDVVRFGETDGFERNTTRPNAWPYRDWLIRALNADLPYDEFARLQLAGDVLAARNAERGARSDSGSSALRVPRSAPDDAVRAAGFMVAGVHNTVLGNDQMRAVARQDELEDLVGTVGQTFLGLTVNCARCHDHKFDPIGQIDFYRLAAALSGAQHGERPLPNPEAAEALAKTTERLRQIEQALAELEAPAWRAVLAGRGQTEGSPPPRPIAAWDFRTGPRDLIGGLHASTVGGVQLTAAGAVFDGQGGLLRTAPLAADLRTKTLEAWVRLGDLQQRGGGVMSVQTPDGAGFDAIVYGEREPHCWMAGSEFFRRTRPLRGPEETERQVVHLAITYDGEGGIAAYRNGAAYGSDYLAKGPETYRAGEAVILFGCRHEPAGGNKHLNGTVVAARLYDRGLTAAEVAASFRAGPALVNEMQLLAHLPPADRIRRAELKQAVARLNAEMKGLRERTAAKLYTAVSQAPGVTRRLVRGQVTDPAEVVAPAGLAALPGADFGLAPNAPDAERRLKLADWVTAPANPLFGRVMVNRLWHHHFGGGLVETPSDFGFNGGRPSHPELLDWLTAEFVRGGYRLKPLHRLIVTSAAYRQASAPRPEAVARDADDRLLWRMRPRRLEAECLRDALLCTAGQLNREFGGKGFSDYRETFLNGTTYFEPIDPAGPAFQRRSVYRFLPRGANQGLLDTFDCPDPAAAAPRRSVTTTPLQALALWNTGFALRMAEALAARVAAEVPDAPERQIDRMWQLTFQRSPTATERDLGRKLVADHGLAALARVLFNANEFLTVD